MPTGWHMFRAPRVPRIFTQHGLAVDVFARSGRNGEVVRLLATVPTPACPALAVAIDAQLALRYRHEATTAGTYLYGGDGDDDRVQLGCASGVLFVDYVDGGRYRQWQHDRQAAVEAYDEAARVALAEQFAHGDAHGLDDAFGLPLRGPLAFPGAVADVAFRVEPPRPLHAWPATYDLTVGEDRALVRVEATVSFDSPALAARAHREVRDALAERFGPLAKDGADHVVLSVGNDHVVVRRLPGLLSVVVIDGRAYEAHRERLAARQQMAKAQHDRYVEALADGF